MTERTVELATSQMSPLMGLNFQSIPLLPFSFQGASMTSFVGFTHQLGEDFRGGFLFFLSLPSELNKSTPLFFVSFPVCVTEKKL